MGRVLEETLITVATEILPVVQPSFRQGLLGAQLALLAATREEFDRAAARRIEENRAIRSLFDRSAALPLDAGLATRLAHETVLEDEDFTIPALDASNDRLRGLFVELHAAVEALPGDAARELESAIWAELRVSTDRRKLAISPF